MVVYPEWALSPEGVARGWQCSLGVDNHVSNPAGMSYLYSRTWRISHLTLPLLRLLSSQGQRCKHFWKQSKPCHVDIHWIALAECSRMSTHMPGLQSFFRLLHHLVLAKLATSSIRANGGSCTPPQTLWMSYVMRACVFPWHIQLPGRVGGNPLLATSPTLLFLMGHYTACKPARWPRQEIVFRANGIWLDILHSVCRFIGFTTMWFVQQTSGNNNTIAYVFVSIVDRNY